MRKKCMASAVLAELLRKVLAETRNPQGVLRPLRKKSMASAVLAELLRKVLAETRLRVHTYALAHRLLRRKGDFPQKFASPHHMVRLRKHAYPQRLLRRPKHPRRPELGLRSHNHACPHRLLRRREHLLRARLARRNKHGGTVAMQSTVQLRTAPNPQEVLRQVGHAKAHR